MGNILIKLAWAIISRTLTETFLSKAIVYSLYSLSKNTANTLDDKMVDALAEALAVADYKKVA
jgi:hypothetical protein